MDDSFMSIEDQSHVFDDDDFIAKALNDSSSTSSTLKNPGSSAKKRTLQPPKIDVSDLVLVPKSTEYSNIPKIKLDFNTLDTPKIPSNHHNINKKRRQCSRRCLSTDLYGEPSENNEQLSFQEFRHSKELKLSNENTKIPKKCTPTSPFSSIENKLFVSPKSNNKMDISLELTPEFNTSQNTRNNKSKEESDISHKIPLKPISNTFPRANNFGGGGLVLQKCFSENHATIMRAVQKSSSDPTLIGDFTKTYALPLMSNSKHQDLRSITCHVLADLLQNRYENFINSYQIIDCRYPYEYEGGHIRTAINLYTKEQILNRFIRNKPQEATGQNQSPSSNNMKRDILIFHCEFSSERGPSLYRFLRNKDRVKNSGVYPYLHYPEIYLLDGGYKEFYTHYSHLCDPCGYKPMHSKNHEEDLRKFRSICKSFDSKYSTTQQHQQQKRSFRL